MKAYYIPLLTLLAASMLSACGNSEDPVINSKDNIPVIKIAETESSKTENYEAESSEIENCETENSDIESSTVENSENIKESDETNAEPEEWKTKFEQSLLDNYEVTVDHYEDLGNGIYQVYVEIDGNVVPYVTVDSNTGDYHG